MTSLAFSTSVETFIFADPDDDRFMLRSHPKQALYRVVLLHSSTDSKCLFDQIIESLLTNERRLMLDKPTKLKGYKQNQISYICLVRSGCNVMDGLSSPEIVGCCTDFATLIYMTPR